MSDISKLRQCIALPKRFFCDGPYYVLTSSSLGNRGLDSEAIAETLGTGNAAGIKRLMQQGICIPLFFPGDCAFDHAIVVVGDLTEQEASEWIGRITWKLDIPCGKLLIICGGGTSEDFDGAISGEGYQDCFAPIDVPPGSYLVEIFAYVSSMNVDFYFEEDEPLEDWFHQTRPGLPLPQWLELFNEGRAIGELSDELVSYLVRLSPLETEPPFPALVEDINWCGEFEFRRPERCPLGIARSDLVTSNLPD